MLLLYSGGPDCHVAWHYLNKPKCLYVNMGHRYANRELTAIRNIAKLEGDMQCAVFNNFNLGLFEKEDAEIPMRNMFLAMIGSNLDDEIVLVAQKGEQSIPDRSPGFFKKASKIISFLNKRRIKIFSPFTNMTKQDMFKWYKDSGKSILSLKETWSCFSGTTIPCGECPACFRRAVAMAYIGIEEEHLKDIWKWEGIQTYIKKFKYGEYDRRRTKQTMEILRKKWEGELPR